MSNPQSAAVREILNLGEDNPRVSESEFFEKWILTLREYIAGGNVEIGVWLSNMGVSVFGEVDVHDDNGEVLFTVPSIFAKQDSVLPKSVTGDISDIMYRANNLNKVMPGKGSAYIRSELVEQVRANKSISEYQRRWDLIFTRYNLDPVFTTVSTTGGIIDDNDEDAEDYEEL